MIATSGSLQDRVQRLVKARAKDKGGFERDIYEWMPPSQPITIRETEAQGKADVELQPPDGCQCLRLWLPTGLFGILGEDKNADGALLLIWPQGGIEAHVVECKKTVSQSEWDKATRQMQWTLTKLQALVGALGERLDRAFFYTAFRSDCLSEDDSPNPSYGERTLDIPENAAGAEMNKSRRKQIEWMRDQIRLQGFDDLFVHKKIKLNESGFGTATFLTDTAHLGPELSGAEVT